MDLLTLRALDAAPSERVLRAASALSAASLDEIRALSLAERYPQCSPRWFSTDLILRRSPGLNCPGLDDADDGVSAVCCPDCLRDDKGLGRVAHIRAHWALTAETICPLHRCSLRKQCPGCGGGYKDYAFPHAAGVWRPCCDFCGLPCDAVPGDAPPASSAPGIEFLLSFEASLGAALQGRPVDQRWDSSGRGSALLRLVGDLGWALVQIANGSGELVIARLQMPQFLFLRSHNEGEGECTDVQLPDLPVESRRAVFAVVAAMLRPDLACQIWPGAHAFRDDPLRNLLEHLRIEDRSALLARARAWPRSLRVRIAVECTTLLPRQRKRSGTGRPGRKHERQGRLMV